MKKVSSQIILQADLESKKISTIFKKYFGQENGIDLNIPNQHKPDEPLNIDE